MYYIYEITNLVNGKTYIGQRKCPRGKTIEQDYYMGSGVHLRNAKRKYGFKNFTKRIIVSGIETKEEINRLEVYWIAEYRKIGKAEYNHTNGGDGFNISEQPIEKQDAFRKKISDSMKEKCKNEDERKRLATMNIGRHHSEETKRKISEALKGKHFSEESRKKMSEWQIGRVSPRKGVHLTDETKEKLRNANLGKHHSMETRKKMGKKIICVELNRVFDSIALAKEETGITHIVDVLKGKLKTAGGYHWRYA